MLAPAAPRWLRPLAPPARAWKEVPEQRLGRLECLESSQSSRTSGTWLIAALILALLIPTELSLRLGPLRLSPYRCVLIAAFVPLALRWSTGRAGRVTGIDLAVLGFALWGWVALAVNAGAAASIEPGGILLLESFGAYLVGRTLVRDRATFAGLCRVAVLACALSLAVSLPESLSGRRFVHQTLGAFLPGAPTFVVEPRFGLARAFGTFDHPILNGVFASTCLALAWYGCGPAGIGGRVSRVLLVTASAMTSLSSGAFLSMAVQIGLASYRRAARALPRRWLLLVLALLTAYGIVSALSSRSGLQALIWYLAFDRTTASYRLLIWEHGSNSVGANPWFGVGQGEWERPEWMSGSVDSFWLMTTMSFGLPALLLVSAAIVGSLVRAGRRIRGDAAEDRARFGWILAWIALVFAGFTVHYWNNVFAFLWLLLGAGAWMGETRRRAA
ncbi:MAG: O-antigen ligase family protein [Planctomycetota bacterium]|nr:O-antigen ligase family protein [Planctomycetota bacterium]